MHSTLDLEESNSSSKENAIVIRISRIKFNDN